MPRPGRRRIWPVTRPARLAGKPWNSREAQRYAEEARRDAREYRQPLRHDLRDSFRRDRIY